MEQPQSCASDQRHPKTAIVFCYYPTRLYVFLKPSEYKLDYYYRAF